MKTIRTFENVVEAEMMRQVLENEGVRACVIDGFYAFCGCGWSETCSGRCRRGKSNRNIN